MHSAVGLHPGPTGKIYSAPPDLAGFRGPTSKEGAVKGGEGRDRGRKFCPFHILKASTVRD